MPSWKKILSGVGEIFVMLLAVAALLVSAFLLGLGSVILALWMSGAF